MATENFYDKIKSEALRKGNKFNSLQKKFHELFTSGKTEKEAIMKMSQRLANC